MERVKQYVWKARFALMTAAIVAMVTIPALADDTQSEIATIDVTAITAAFTNGFNSMVINSINMISAMVPIALTLAGVTFLVRKAMSWFKGVAK